MHDEQSRRKEAARGGRTGDEERGGQSMLRDFGKTGTAAADVVCDHYGNVEVGAERTEGSHWLWAEGADIPTHTHTHNNTHTRT